MSDRYMNEDACGIEPEYEGDEPTLDQWRAQCRRLWRENVKLRIENTRALPAGGGGDINAQLAYARSTAILFVTRYGDLCKDIGLSPEQDDAANTLLQLKQLWDGHRSDCSTHNMPAYPNGPCDCGAIAPQTEERE